MLTDTHLSIRTELLCNTRKYYRQNELKHQVLLTFHSLSVETFIFVLISQVIKSEYFTFDVGEISAKKINFQVKKPDE